MKIIGIITYLSSFILVTVFCWACSSARVSVHPVNSSIQLSDYKTFDFFELEASGDTTSNFNQYANTFKSEVIKEMNRRGLKQHPDNPDLQINMGFIVEEKTQTRQTSLSDPGEWTYIGQRNYKWESKTVELGTYKEGSITLHLVDNATNEAVWVGTIEGILPKNPDKRQNVTTKAVSSLFEKIDQSGE